MQFAEVRHVGEAVFPVGARLDQFHFVRPGVLAVLRAPSSRGVRLQAEVSLAGVYEHGIAFFAV
jgi:hypothetical protein